MKKILIGFIVRILNILVPVRKKHWVFGSDVGKMYREGSKYLLEYMLKNHPDYQCTFITRNWDVVRELKEKGIPVAHNYSIKGIYTVAVADCVFTTQVLGDIYYAYKKKDRTFYYLVHGQPFKVAMKMLPQTYREKVVILSKGNDSWLTINILKLKKILSKTFVEGYEMEDVSFVSSTSPFTALFQRKEFPISVDVKILGMPRNDALFDAERMKAERWDESFVGKYVITYMPTHRMYGRGELSLTPFLYREDVQQWMQDNNVILLVKQHPNMIRKMTSVEETDVIKNISKSGYDPQVVIYHSNLLITDYSSVWMDYLLMRRPLIFYFYDNFENEDAGCYYDLRVEFPHNYCESEDELFSMIKQAYANSESLIPSKDEVYKYHQYVDANSCQRYYDEIVKTKYGKE